MTAAHHARSLCAWFSRQRRDLPWRRTGAAGQREPYASWVAEVMLQQTRVEVAAPYFERFMSAFPGVADLAAASEEEVLKAWAGLGYYRRARLLHAAAREVMGARQGRLPRGAAAWRQLPGVGAYTAAAIAALTENEAAPAVDGNVRRVAARVLGLDLPAGASALHAAAEAWEEELARCAAAPGELVEALMELGATVCLPRAPRCGECPWSGHCRARAEGNEERFPRADARPAMRELRLLGFVAARGSGWLLRERQEGWNPGLWEPPTAPDEAGLEPSAAWRGLGLGRARGLRELGHVRHVITRHQIRVRVFAVEGWRDGPPAIAAAGVGLTGLGRKMLRLHAAAAAGA